jgi:hypothetical protein
VLITALALAFHVSVAAEESLAPLSLATEGNTKYRIFVAGKATPAEQYAASELKTFLEEITGATFPIVHRAKSHTHPVIVVGNNELVERVIGPLAMESMSSYDSFRIATRGRSIYFVGKSPRGTLYAVYYFLERYLGCRWYSATHSIIPSRKSVALSAINLVEKPAFEYREVFSKPADDIRFGVRNRLNGQLGHRRKRNRELKYGEGKDIDNITVFQLIDPKKYRRDHPEYFGSGQVRFGNAAVQQVAVEKVRKRLRSMRHVPSYLLISPEDRVTYYRRGKDGVLIEQGGSAATAYIEFMRVIANSLKHEFPTVKVLALAYRWSRIPPAIKKLPTNMGIMLSDIDSDFGKPLTSAENRGFLRDLEGWSQVADEIIVWDYIANMANYLHPGFNLTTMAENVQILSKYPSVHGVFEQGAYTGHGGELSELKAWLLAKLLWDPKLDAMSLIKEFAEGFYGAGAPYVLEYLALLEASSAANPMRLEVKTPLVGPYLSAGVLGRADRLFAKAESVVSGDAARLRHIQAARLPVDYAILATETASEHGEHRAARYQRFRKYVRKLNVTAYREGRDKSASVGTLLEILAFPRRRSFRPAQCAARKEEDCVELQDYAFRLAGDASLVADEGASDGVAAQMTGKSQVWGIQVPLDWLLPKEGKWQIFIDTRVDASDWPANKPVLNAGIYPGKKKPVRLGDQGNQIYRSVSLPGQWKRNSRRVIWIAPAAGKSIEHIYVDRILAVRTQN